MTIWSDYKPTPADNIAAPPVGAPEGMWPSATNDVLREIMSVINQLGAQVTSTFAGLGTMATQNSTNVSITGGTITGVTISGSGAGLTSLNASQLTTGKVPAPALDGGTYNCTVTSAIYATMLGGMTAAQLMPVGGIIPYYGNLANLPFNWHVCDGTNGTPDLRDRYIRGVSPSTGFGSTFGSYTGGADLAGLHNHGGTQPHTLTVSEMPSHTHPTTMGWGYMNNPGGANLPAGTTTPTANTFTTNSTGGDQPHTHGIANDGNHTHAIHMDAPPSMALYWIMRMS